MSIKAKIEESLLGLVETAEKAFPEPGSGKRKYQLVVDQIQKMVPMGELVPDDWIESAIETAVVKLKSTLQADVSK